MPDITPRLDPKTTRLAVVHLTYVLISGSGWPIRLVNDAKVAIPLVGVRPSWADESKPPCIANTLIAEPDLRVGTVDELVAEYREHLEASLNAANQDPNERHDLAITQASFADTPSGSVPPLFSGSTR